MGAAGRSANRRAAPSLVATSGPLAARGAVEHGAGHYPVIVACTRLDRRDGRRGLAEPVGCCSPRSSWWRPPRSLRYWTIATLGPQWTTRVIVDPTAEPVVDGPYRWLRHPNYVAVAAEIAAFPLVFGAWRTALAFTAADALVLRHRIEVEDRARSTRPGGSRPE